jgi:hypothetical protein
MKVHGVHIHYGLMYVFGYSFENSLCYGYSKTIHEIFIQCDYGSNHAIKNHMCPLKPLFYS